MLACGPLQCAAAAAGPAGYTVNASASASISNTYKNCTGLLTLSARLVGSSECSTVVARYRAAITDVKAKLLLFEAGLKLSTTILGHLELGVTCTAKLLHVVG